MVGGALQNMTYAVAAGSTARLVATNSGGTLNNVTLAGPMDMRTGTLSVVTGLTLQNVTQPIGDPAGATAFNLRLGTLTVGGTGTFVFGASAGNLFDVGALGNNTLTYGPGITFRGHSGSIAGSTLITPNTILNIQGTVQADVAGGTINVGRHPSPYVPAHTLTTTGTLRALNGGNLHVELYDRNNDIWTNSAPIEVTGGSFTVGTNTAWTNTAPITATNATLNFAGIIGSASLSNVTTSGGTVNINSSIDLAGGTLTVDGTNGTVWNLGNGATIKNGTIASANGGVLNLLNGSGLDNVTVATGATVSATGGATFTLLYGLTINGTLLLGDAAGSGSGVMNAPQTQTIGGTGSIVFGGHASNAITAHVNNVFTSFTISFGAGLTIRGKNGKFGGTTAFERTNFCFSGHDPSRRVRRNLPVRVHSGELAPQHRHPRYQSRHRADPWRRKLVERRPDRCERRWLDARRCLRAGVGQRSRSVCPDRWHRSAFGRPNQHRHNPDPRLHYGAVATERSDRGWDSPNRRYECHSCPNQQSTPWSNNRLW
jgi:hypothetical protein